MVGNGLGGAGGGGAGGGAYISAGTLQGAGSLTALGGAGSSTNNEGGGGGGRIAIYYTDPGTSTWTKSAYGGTDVQGGEGGAGTIYTKPTSGDGDLVFNNNNLTTFSGSTPFTAPATSFNSITVTSRANVSHMNGNSQAIEVGTLVVSDNGVLLHPDANTTTAYRLNVNATDIDIQSTGSVNVNSLGFLGGTTAASGQGYSFVSGAGNETQSALTNGSSGAYGGSYAGTGGTGTGNGGAVGPAYGDLTNPLHPGGGGGGWSNSASYFGGDGGGLVRMMVSGTLNLSGSITANGGNGASGAGGGGAGGGVYINAGTITGTGTVSVIGGNGISGNNEGGGAGGRVAIYYTTDSGTWTKNAYGGTDAQGGEGGGGTIYLETAGAGNLIVNGNNVGTQAGTPLFISGAATQYDFQDLTVINGSTLTIASPGVCSPNAVIVRGTITTTSGTITQTLLDSNGVRCMNRAHQYLNYPGTLTFTQPDIDNYDFYKRFSLTSNGVLQFALHSNLLYTAADIDLTGLTHEADGTKIAISVPANANLHTKHTLYIPNTNAGNGVYLCPTATTLAGVTIACSGRVTFAPNEFGGAGKTVGSATGVVVTLVNATDTGAGTSGNATHLYKVVGLANTGGGPFENVEFTLNNGSTTATPYDDVQITDVTTNGVSGLPANTNAAYRWTINGVNLMALNIPFNAAGSAQSDFSGNSNSGTVLGPVNPATPATDCKVGTCLSFDGVNDYVSVAHASSLNMPSNNVTLAAWVYPRTDCVGNGDGRQTIVTKSNAYYLNLVSCQPSFYWYSLSNPGYHTSPGALPLNAWSHVVAQYDGDLDQVRIYVNGVQTLLVSNITGTGQQSTDTVRIGGFDPTFRNLDGLLDEVQIYPRALTVEQIQQLCNDGDSDGDCSDGIDAGQGVGGPSIIKLEETSSGNILNAYLTPVGLDGVVGSTVTSANTVSITSPLVNFTLSNQSPNENVANPTIEVTLSTADSLGTNTVNYAVTGTATGGGKDYTLANGTLTFIANDTSEMIPLVIVDDVLREISETVIITLNTASSNILLGSTIVHTYTITDNETMTVLLDNGNSSVDTALPLTSSVDVNSTGNFTAATTGAYRWTVNGVNWMSFNMPFASESATENDFSGNAFNGTVTGATYLTSGCKVGHCRSFDGNDSISLPTSLGYTSVVSAFAWFKSSGVPPGGFHIIMGGQELEISISTAGVLRTGVTTSSGRFVSDHGTGLTDGNWHHVGFTYDGVTKTTYIEGVSVGTLPITGTLVSAVPSRSIGKFGSSPTYFLNGIIDEVQIYPRVLSSNQVDQLYDDGVALVGGPTVIEPEHTVGNEIWQLHVTHLGSVGATVSSNTVTIDAPLMNFTLGSQSQNESVTAPTIEVTLSSPDAAGVNTVNYVVTGSATGGGKDYTLANGVLTFLANDTSEMIPLSVVNDLLFENSETVIITLNSPSGNAVLGNTTSYTYTITDNETMTVELNGGAPTHNKSLPLTHTVDVNSTGNFTAGTQGAYRWILNGANYMASNIPFNEGVNQTDIIGNSSAIVGSANLNPATPATDCKVGNCLNFPGTSSVYTNGAVYSSAPNNFTYSFWAKPNATRTATTQSTSGTAGTSGQRYLTMPIFSAAPNAGAGVSVGTNGVSVFEHASNYVPSLLVHAATITDWTHIAVVYTNKTPSLYLNGSLVATGLTSPRTSVFPGSYLGDTNTGWGAYSGLVDEFQVYPRALSAAQITQLYNDGTAGVGGPSSITSAELLHNQVWGLELTHMGSVGAFATAPTTTTIVSPGVNFSLASQDSDENIASPTVAVTLSFADPSSSNTVNYAVTGGTAVGSGEDYTLANGTLTFLANDTSENILLTIVDDLLKEGSDTIVITLSSPSAGIILGATTVHTLTIIDNETMVVSLNPNYPVGNPPSNDYLSAANPLESSVNVNGTGDFSVGTIGAYRWIKNGLDYAHFSMPINTGATQLDFSGNTTSSMLLQSNAAHTMTGCKVGGCLSLDGADDTLIIRNVANTAQSTIFNSSTSLTISAWVKSTTPGIIISNHNANSTWESVQLDTSVFVINAANSSAATRKILNYPSVADGNWHHVVGVWTGTQMFVYVDGAQVAGPLAQASPPWTTTQLTYVGALHVNGTVPSSEITGAIDELQIYKRVLSAQQILAMYNDGLGSSQNANDGAGGPASIVSQELAIGDEWSLNVTQLGSVGVAVPSANTVEVVSSLGAMQLNGDANDEVEEDVDVEFSFVGTPLSNSTLGHQWLVDPDGVGAGAQQKFMANNYPMNSGATQIDVSGNDRDSTLVGGNVLSIEYTLYGGGNQHRIDSFVNVAGLPGYVIPPTSCLEYDIAWKEATALIAVDFAFTPPYDPPGPTLGLSGDFRDSGAIDQNGYPAHFGPEADLTPVASDGVTGYYSRRISASHIAGHSITKFMIAGGASGSEPKHAFISNVRMTNCSGTTLLPVYISGPQEFVQDDYNSHPSNTLVARTGPPAFQTSGCKVGGCFDFPGTSGALNAADSTVTNTFSMEFWAKPEATRLETTEQNADLTISGVRGQRYAVFPPQKGTDAGVGVSVGTNGVSVFEHGNDHLPSLLVHNTSITDWTHVVVTYDLKRPKLYLNGVLVRTGIKSLRPTIYPGTDLGGQPQSSPATAARGDTYGPYVGLLDEFKVYPRVITPQQIYQNYLDGVAGNGGPTKIVSQEHDVDEEWTAKVFEVTNIGGLTDTAIPVDTVTIVPGDSETYMGITTPPSSPTLSNDITIDYTCRNDDDLPRDIMVEFSTNGGGSWAIATVKSSSTSGGVSENNILDVPCSSTLPDGSVHTFVWDSFLDAAGSSGIPDLDIRIRVTADTSQVGASVLTASTGNFAVQNARYITGNTSGPYSGDVICEGGDDDTPVTITMDGTQNLTSLTLLHGCILTHTLNSSTPLTINVTGNVYVDATSQINLDQKGHLGAPINWTLTHNGGGLGGGIGNGCFGCDSSGGGASYGGKGANGALGNAGTSGPIHGDFTDPLNMGSGGGGHSSGTASARGGNGGGLVIMNIIGTFQNDGIVTANGEDGAGAAGGGSGGGINITAASLAGIGTFHANGGSSTNVDGPSGGGGRIALKASSGTVSNSYAYEAYSFTDSGGEIGGAGTVFFQEGPNPGNLIIDNNDNVPQLVIQDISTLITGPQTFDEVIIRDKAMLSYNSAWTIGTLTVDDGTLVSNTLDQLTIDTVSVVNGGNLTTRNRDGTIDYTLNLSVQDITIDATSTINLDERGYRGGLSDGNASYWGEGAGGGVGSNCYGCPVASGGGGHGGKGANGTGASHNNAGGAAFGSYDDPVTMGGGGGATGSGSATGAGGDGGGLVIITAADSFVHNGIISSNGGALNDNRGSGAGGGISITAATLTGSGTIRANGGASSSIPLYPNTIYGGSGAGGRIALVAISGTVSNTYTLQAFPGGGTGNVSGAGTIYKKDPGSDPDLIIDANNQAPTEIDVATPFTPLSPFRTISISNDAALTANVAFTIDDLIIDGGTFLSAINTAHSVDSTTITNGGNATVPVRTATTDYSLRIDGATLSVDATSTINLNGKGYRGGISNGNGSYYGEGSGGGGGANCFSCSQPASGGGHGGAGAQANYPAGPAYGNLEDPVTMGSGGGATGSGSATSAGGGGGGAVILTVSGNFTNDGVISSDGETRTGAVGGGSGGTISVMAGTYLGSGVFRANGGSAGNTAGGAGGGGRIALVATTGTVSGTYTTEAFTGTVGLKGAAGTIYLKDSNLQYGDFIVDNNNIVSTAVTPLFITGQATQYQFQDFAVRDGAILNVNTPGVCSPFAVVIRGTVDSTGGTVNHGLNDSNGLRCMNRVHQYQNFPATLTLTQPDIDNYDYFKRFRLTSDSTLQFALHSHLLYNNANIDLTGLLHETNGTKIAISIPSDGNLHTRHALYIPNTNAGDGVLLCPSATAVADVGFWCSGRVDFTSGQVDGLTAKTVGTATGVTVSLVNATDTGVGSAGNPAHLYKVVGLNSTGGGPLEDGSMDFDLNDGVLTAGDNANVQITNISSGGNPGIPPGINLAYRWTVDAANLMFLNMPMDEESDGVLDTSGNGSNGTASGAVYTASGKVGGAMSFDGVNDYVEISGASMNPGLSDFTISAWFKVPAGGSQFIIDKAFTNSGPMYYLAVVAGGGLDIRILDNNASGIGDVVRGSGFDNNAFHFVTWTVNRATDISKIYVDGVQQGADIDISSVIAAVDPAPNARLGLTTTGQYPLLGIIDEFQMYSRVLSEAQIALLYANGNAGVSGPPIIDAAETANGDVWNLIVTPIDDSTGIVYSPFTSANTVTIALVPEAITDLAATSGNTQVTLAWTAPADNGSAITDYIVEYNSGAGYQVFNDGVSGTTGAVVTGLVNGTSYTFRVKAVNANGESAYSNTDTETPANVADAVADLDAAAGNTQVVLTWSTPADNGSAITDYVVEYGTTSGFPGNIQVFNDGVSATTGAIVIGLVNGTDYSFQVKAVNGAGEGAASNVDTAMPVYVPAAVSDLVGTPGNLEVFLTWSAPANNGSAITDYIVEYGATSGFPGNIQVFSDGVSATTGTTVTGLVNGTDYSFQVKTVNAIGTGPASNVDTTTPDADAPAAVNNLNANAGNAQVSLTWSAPANNGSAITDYIIEYNDGTGYQVFSDGVSATTGVTVTGLVNGTDYLFRIAAVNVIGTGPYSNVVGATPSLVPPSGDDAQITVDVTDFLSFSIVNIAAGDEPAGDQPFGTGTQRTPLNPGGVNTYAISGDTGIYTQLRANTNSVDGYNVTVYTDDTAGRTVSLRSVSGDQIPDTLPSTEPYATLNTASDTGLAIHLMDASTDTILRESDEDTQWGDGDAGTALWAALPIGLTNALVIYDTFDFSDSPTTAFINWFVGANTQQPSGTYSGQQIFTAIPN